LPSNSRDNGINSSAIFALDTPLHLPRIILIGSYYGQTSRKP